MIGIRKFEGAQGGRCSRERLTAAVSVILRREDYGVYPEYVFAGAEKPSHRTKRSRSDIYSAAVREYVERHSSDAVTQGMNAVIERINGAGADTFVSLAARNTLVRVDW
jgi:hypothetical protein